MILLKADKSKISYVLITVIISLLRFVRGFVFMKLLSLSELGIITLVSTIMGLFVILQIGFLNGGYRIFSVNNPNKWKVNDTIYSYFFILEGIIFIGILISFLFNQINIEELFLGILAAFFGLILILNNWNRNILIAQHKLKEINKLELIATIISFLFLILVFWFGLIGALIVIFSRELIFYILTVARNKNYLPQKFSFNFPEAKWILSFGFLPFIAGTILQMNIQVETWSIASFLSTEELGKFYLPQLYITLFLIVPQAINKLYFPRVMQEFVLENFNKVKKFIKLNFILNISYTLFVIIVSFFFMELVIKFVVPEHLVGIPFIWIIIPGLSVYVILQPINLIFNAAVRLNPFIWSSAFGFVLTAIMLLIFGFNQSLSLEKVALAKTLSYSLISLILLAILMYNKQNIWKVNYLKENLNNKFI